MYLVQVVRGFCR